MENTEQLESRINYLVNSYGLQYNRFIEGEEKSHLIKMTKSIVVHPEMAGSFCKSIVNGDWETAASKADEINARHFHYYFYLKANQYVLQED